LIRPGASGRGRTPRPLAALREFLRLEAAGGFVLMGAAALALVVANSPLAPLYFRLLELPLGVRVGGLVLEEDLLHWINDGLMAVFFLLVGLEIKREMVEGELASWPRRALPGIAAAGGMLAPALIYVICARGEGEALRGWAIPSATDIAFALGVLSLLGSRAPASLKAFLTALAILDDLGAIVIIALFYTAELHMTALAAALFGIAVLNVLNRLGVGRLAPYLVIGFLVWLAVLESGVHATLAGVAVALTIPLRTRDGRAPLHRLERGLHGPVALGIVPIFGFANAGISFAGLEWRQLLDPVPLGIMAGLFLGKQIGVVAATWGAVRLRLGALPEGAGWTAFYGVAVLCGIGFTMSLFIGSLAFPDPALITETKLGVFGGSLLSAALGYAVLRLTTPRPPAGAPPDKRPAQGARSASTVPA
jgi:NhaA family Na+:H+ antiporter